MVREISVAELAASLAAGSTPLLLDVREGWEVAIAALPGITHIPMNLIPIRQGELPDDAPIVVICHHGVRSYQVAGYLQHVGFDDVVSLRGGMAAWAEEIDPNMAKY